MMPSEFKVYLSPDAIIDSDHERVTGFARKVVGGSLADPVETAVTLYYAVRDDIRYDPYLVSPDPEDYRASVVLKQGRGFCVQKAALLCALGRASEIPSRLGFATVRNHLASKQLIEFVGGDLFVFHGYTEFFLNGKWVKATPAFNKELCRRHQVTPLAFNGREDSIFQAYNSAQKRFMEYTEYYGEYSTVPMQAMLDKWRAVYGNERVATWFQRTAKHKASPRYDFYQEEPV